jgi:hypothetical protein
MALYSVRTKKEPEEVVEQAIDYFGEEGVGLSVNRENPCCVTFQGGGGHVSVTASREEDRTEVELETREWDYHVKKFMNLI